MLTFICRVKFLVLFALLALLAGCGSISSGGKGAQPAEGSETLTVRFGFPVEYLREKNSCYELDASYPFFGRPEVDQQLRVWVDTVYHDAQSVFAEGCRDVPSLRGRQQFIMDYEVFTTPYVISVVFHSWIYAGGAHGNDSVQSMNILAGTGNELAYKDIFANTDGLWVFLSDYVYEHLRPELGQTWLDSPQFTEGLEPVEGSFAHFAVTPQGITIFFPTYQIAPYSAGPQQCDVPLSALIKFLPKPGIWQ